MTECYATHTIPNVSAGCSGLLGSLLTIRRPQGDLCNYRGTLAKGGQQMNVWTIVGVLLVIILLVFLLRAVS